MPLQNEQPPVSILAEAEAARGSKLPGDNWANLSTYACSTCRFYVPKQDGIGRCRRNAPTMDGFPAVYPDDWCGQHKLGTNPSKDLQREAVTSGYFSTIVKEGGPHG